MDRSIGPIDLLSVQKNPIAITSNCRIEFELLIADRKLQGMPFDAHLAAAHGMAPNHSAIRDNAAGTG